MIGSIPATADPKALREATDALRHTSRDMVLLIATALHAQHAQGEASAPLDDAFGPEPSQGAYNDAIAWNVATGTERRQSLIERSITRHAAARRLGVSAQAVSDMLDRGALVGLKEGREWRLPEWQFEPESPTGVLPGLRDIVARFPASIIALSRWIERENPDLNGLTPRSALQREKAEDVLRLVETL
jgi:hypothetical protein